MVHPRGFSGPTGFEGAGMESEDEHLGAESVARTDDPSLGVHRRATRRWWHRHLNSEERQRVMAELAIKRQEHWAYRFTAMITLSVIVAVMGLSADSAAVVIGAMLLAPLMQPVLATAACIAMALFRKSLRSFGVVALATLWAIVLSYVLAALFVNGELPNEVTSRTAPDIRDLVVALAAGTAGACRDRAEGCLGVASRCRCRGSRWCRHSVRSASPSRPATPRFRVGSDAAVHAPTCSPSCSQAWWCSW